MVTWKNCIRILICIFTLFLGFYYWKNISAFLGLMVGALTPIVIGLAIAYVVNIVMRRYEMWYFPKSKKKFWKVTRRPVCMIAATITLAAVIALVVWLIVPELIECVRFLLSEIPPAIDSLLKTPWVVRIVPKDWMVALESIDWVDSISKVVSVAGDGIGVAVSTMVTVVTNVLSGLVTVFLSLVFAIYLLASKERLLGHLTRLGKNYMKEDWFYKVRHAFKTANQCFHRFIVGQCTESVILGVLCLIGMWIFRFPYATMVSVLVGFTALIPVVGAYIGAGVGAIMVLTESPLKALLFIVFIVVLQQLEGNLIYPKVVGDSLGLPAFYVLAAITIGGALDGVVGMLLGVPITATIYRLIRENLRQREREKNPKVSPDLILTDD
ncbi:MAG: AI-2E family transporter [Clostridia bacterium]|nr:AI-2E family transporter [Clostridia bacterium]